MISELAFRAFDRQPVLLTPTEMRLLECLMRNVGTTVTREALIEHIWGYDFLGDSNRVEVYVARLRKKIESDPSAPEFLHTIRGLGYVFRVPQSTLLWLNGAQDGHTSIDTRSSQLRSVATAAANDLNQAVVDR